MRKIFAALGLILALMVMVALGMVAWFEHRVEAPFGTAGSPPIDVTISPGMTAGQVALALHEAGAIGAARDLDWWLRWTDQSAAIQAGEYRFDTPVSVREIAEIITSGRVRLYPLTVPEGSNRWQVAEAIAAAGFGTLEEATAAIEDPGLVADLDAHATTLEGYLFPETYLMPAGTSAREAVSVLVEAMRARWSPERAARAEALGMSFREVMILASLIEAEAQVEDERAVISAVFHNRIARNMLLQTDPTVLYARWLAGKEGRTIYRSDLQRDSPYNTYRYPGLPAGPICSPRDASIAAALAPAAVEFLYFVSRNDGTHAFSATLREHNAFVQEYQR
jgi:UPF0755 protein